MHNKFYRFFASMLTVIERLFPIFASVFIDYNNLFHINENITV